MGSLTIFMHRLTVLALAASLLAPLAGCGEASSSSGSGPRLRFREAGTSDLVRLEVTNASGQAQADTLLHSGAVRWAAGTPLRGDGGFNAPWHWRLDPATVSFPEVTIEACQTVAAGVEEGLDYWIRFGHVCILGTVEAREP